jgi:hypothetical protein
MFQDHDIPDCLENKPLIRPTKVGYVLSAVNDANFPRLELQLSTGFKSETCLEELSTDFGLRIWAGARSFWSAEREACKVPRNAGSSSFNLFIVLGELSGLESLLDPEDCPRAEVDLSCLGVGGRAGSTSARYGKVMSLFLETHGVEVVSHDGLELGIGITVV